jgi:aerobic-type carbon monoxide dehydrogenase small subunit (CoxS/CutS family)
MRTEHHHQITSRRLTLVDYQLYLNQASYIVDTEPDTPLLWVLRDFLGLTGTKYSCGNGLCGSCTVLIDGAAVRSCITPVSAVGDREVTTIEGLSEDGSHPVQQAWTAEKVVQCGYCQPGQIMNAVALLTEIPNPTDEQINAAMAQVLCRCGTYQRIRQAIHTAAEQEVTG